MKLPVIYLKTRRNSLHPWIFQKMTSRPERPIPAGGLVEVRSIEGRFVARGIFNGKSQITVRVLCENEATELDIYFFFEKLKKAHQLRTEDLKLAETGNCYRWVHGEADGLPGLIVDRFGDVVVIAPYSAGYSKRTLDWIVESILEILPGVKIALRPDERSAKREGYNFQIERRKFAGPNLALVKENDLQMSVDLQEGHKTGFFLDQRENRQAVAELAKGRFLLDCFCYTGGFSISSALAGAEKVVGVDLDEKAIEVAKTNAKTNGVEAEFRHADAFPFLRSVAASEERPDLLVLDPPKYASVKDEMARAHKMYGDLNRLGLQAVKPGGLLVTCSCSGLIDEPEFLDIVARSAAEAKVHLQIIRITGAGPDHPWSTHFPEGRYLKAVFGRVIPLNQSH